MTLQPGEQGEHSGAAAPMRQASSDRTGGWERLSGRHQGLLEEDNFVMVPQGSGKCSIVQGPQGIVQKERNSMDGMTAISVH